MGKKLIIKGADFEENAINVANLLADATFTRSTIGRTDTTLVLENSTTRIAAIIDISDVERISCKIQNGYKYIFQYSNSENVMTNPYSTTWIDTEQTIDVPNNTTKLWVAIAHSDNSEIQLSESDACKVYDVTG